MNTGSSTSLDKPLRQGTGKYNTPVEWVKPIHQILGGFDLDPCASQDSKLAKQNIRLTGGLEIDWSNYDTVWVNHPYRRGEPEQWLKKASEADSDTVVTLSKADPSTIWFDRYIWSEADLICFPSSNRDGGRIKFVGEQNRANFPNVISVFGIYPQRLVDYFESLGPTIDRGKRIY